MAERVVVLTTERLVLRHLVPEDLDALAALYADPEVRRWFPDGVRTREQTAAELAWMREVSYPRHGYGLWAAELRSTGELVGRCGLLRWEIAGRAEVEVAYLLGRAHWGRGLGSEAARALVAHGFATLPVDRLIALVTPGNDASARVAEAAGMVLVQDDYVDEEGPAHLYAVSRPPRG